MAQDYGFEWSGERECGARTRVEIRHQKNKRRTQKEKAVTTTASDWRAAPYRATILLFVL
jgi:hypothetical protein